MYRLGNLILKILIGGKTMVDVYVALIVKKRRTIEQVPVQLRAQVLAELTALGLDGNGDPLI
jgi:hypothetical protein